ncbi:hypothetical protein HBA55_29620 [Pseudomaricurvus alkylphenolicus]|uniref:hypothetical protein n=1 Tax=Pseudomaricurvus alkylphenolicus TaxID=1306991 RepID=UPI0014247E52|nr:hypothetical protein [Pseudomaricurvus alkylphenolicus]NIB43798.1 hypothetical protein [Pseudomaricurvus alkylphenolicus]
MQVQEIKRRPQRTGQVRTEQRFTLDDGRVFVRQVNAASDSELATNIAAAQAKLLTRVAQQDAIEAVAQGVSTAYLTATLSQVQFAWLQKGFNETDPVTAYDILKEVAPAVLSLGYTAAQYAAAFGSTEEEAQRLLDRWAYLSSDPDTIEAARALKSGDL